MSADGEASNTGIGEWFRKLCAFRSVSKSSSNNDNKDITGQDNQKKVQKDGKSTKKDDPSKRQQKKILTFPQQIFQKIIHASFWPLSSKNNESNKKNHEKRNGMSRKTDHHEITVTVDSYETTTEITTEKDTTTNFSSTTDESSKNTDRQTEAQRGSGEKIATSMEGIGKKRSTSPHKMHNLHGSKSATRQKKTKQQIVAPKRSAKEEREGGNVERTKKHTSSSKSQSSKTEEGTTLDKKKQRARKKSKSKKSVRKKKDGERGSATNKTGGTLNRGSDSSTPLHSEDSLESLSDSEEPNEKKEKPAQHGRIIPSVTKPYYIGRATRKFGQVMGGVVKGISDVKNKYSRSRKRHSNSGESCESTSSKQKLAAKSDSSKKSEEFLSKESATSPMPSFNDNKDKSSATVFEVVEGASRPAVCKMHRYNLKWKTKKTPYDVEKPLSAENLVTVPDFEPSANVPEEETRETVIDDALFRDEREEFAGDPVNSLGEVGTRNKAMKIANPKQEAPGKLDKGIVHNLTVERTTTSSAEEENIERTVLILPVPAVPEGAQVQAEIEQKTKPDGSGNLYQGRSIYLTNFR